jgi:adenylate cyclase
MWYAYVLGIPNRVLMSSTNVLRDTAEVLAMCERSGDDLAIDLARVTRGVALAYRHGPEHQEGLSLLAKVRDRALNGQFSLTELPITDIQFAREKTRLGDFDDAIALARTAVDDAFASTSFWRALATEILVEALLHRGHDRDIDDAQHAVDWLAAVHTDPGFVVHEVVVLRLRALLARAKGEDADYREYRDRYRKMANELGFEGHMAIAEAMP